MRDEANIANMGLLISSIKDDRKKTQSQVQVLELQRNDIKFSEHTAMNLNNVLQNGNLTILDISYNHLGDLGI
jgi:methylthioribose-1-phosphate isomerase